MAGENAQPPGAPSGRRRPPTIELEATEVTPKPAAAEPSDAPPDPPDRNAATADRDRSSTGPMPRGMTLPLLGAGAVGAAGMFVVVLLLWVAGLLPRPQDPMVALGPRIGAIETQLRELAARPQPAAVDAKAIDELRARLNTLDPKALDELKARLAKLETAPAAPPAPATDAAMLGRLAATDDAVKTLAANVEQLTRRIDAVVAQFAEVQNATRASGADRNEIAVLAGKITALEQSAQAARDELAQRAVASAGDRAARLATLAMALRDAIARGAPFSAELAAVKPLAANAATLAALEPYAASGVPSPAALGRELVSLVEPMRQAANATARDNGFIGRLQANAEKLVRIRPVGELPGDEPPAIIARIAVKAAHDDIDGALAELAKLPAAVRAPAQAWIAKAQARQDAVAAANRLATDALTALKAP